MIRKSLTMIVIFLFILFNAVKVSSQDRSVKEMISVEIKGEVENPGIYELERGSSIKDLLEKAVLKDDSDISGISVNRILSNDEIIVIPRISETKLISINSAGIEELCSLPGIGPALAGRIIDYRNRYGSFNELEELMNVKGIGNVKFAKIKQYITL